METLTPINEEELNTKIETEIQLKNPFEVLEHNYDFQINKNEAGIIYINLIGKGSNIRNGYAKVFFAKSTVGIAEEIIKTKAEIDQLDTKESLGEKNNKLKDLINQTILYKSEKGNMVLRKKTDSEADQKTLTFFLPLVSGFRGTTFVEKTDKAMYQIATGSGNIGESSELVVSIENNGYIIVYEGGRYSKAFTMLKNEGGVLKKIVCSNEGKYCDRPTNEQYMLEFGLVEDF